MLQAEVGGEGCVARNAMFNINYSHVPGERGLEQIYEGFDDVTENLGWLETHRRYMIIIEEQ